jgi:hypothetical protein
MKKVSRRKTSGSVISENIDDGKIYGTIDGLSIGDCDSEYDFKQLFEGKASVFLISALY